MDQRFTELARVLLALVVVVGIGVRDPVHVFSIVGDSQSPGAPMRIAENVFVLDATEEHRSSYPFFVRYYNVSVLLRLAPSFKDILGRRTPRSAVLIRQVFLSKVISRTIEHYANATMTAFGVSRKTLIGAKTPLNFRGESGSLSKVMNRHSPRAFEHAGLGSVLFLPWGDTALGNSPQSCADHIGALGTFGCGIDHEHGEPTNQYQTVSKENKQEIVDLGILTDPLLKRIGIAVIGITFLFFGFLFALCIKEVFAPLGPILIGIGLYCLFWWAK